MVQRGESLDSGHSQSDTQLFLEPFEHQQSGNKVSEPASLQRGANGEFPINVRSNDKGGSYLPMQADSSDRFEYVAPASSPPSLRKLRVKPFLAGSDEAQSHLPAPATVPARAFQGKDVALPSVVPGGLQAQDLCVHGRESWSKPASMSRAASVIAHAPIGIPRLTSEVQTPLQQVAGRPAKPPDVWSLPRQQDSLSAADPWAAEAKTQSIQKLRSDRQQTGSKSACLSECAAPMRAAHPALTASPHAKDSRLSQRKLDGEARACDESSLRRVRQKRSDASDDILLASKQSADMHSSQPFDSKKHTSGAPEAKAELKRSAPYENSSGYSKDVSSQKQPDQEPLRQRSRLDLQILVVKADKLRREMDEALRLHGHLEVKKANAPRQKAKGAFLYTNH